MDPINLQDTKSLLFLRAVLDAFQEKAISYVMAGTSPKERFDRVNDVKNFLIATATPQDINVDQSYSACPPDRCEGGVCTLRAYNFQWDQFHPE
ncbi:MAG: hypothetical protein HY231_12775 [Acidobacteria bacterium]|nr:hypothetical protein [Acidobacteriota bacterium]